MLRDKHIPTKSSPTAESFLQYISPGESVPVVNVAGIFLQLGAVFKASRCIPCDNTCLQTLQRKGHIVNVLVVDKNL